MSVYLLLTYILGVLLASIAQAFSIPLYPPCAMEDGSTPGQQFPCLWDARKQGNHVGTSYILFDPPVS